MKIRTGFVSNSSSSSFCMYGRYLFLRNNADETMDDAEKLISCVIDSLGLSLKFLVGYDFIVVGLPIMEMNDIETRRNFENRADAALLRLLQDDSIKKIFDTESGSNQFQYGEIQT